MPDERPEFQDLMERIRAGSEDAVRELLCKYGIHILRVIRRRLHKKLRTKYDSQDFTQAVWASFFAHRLQQNTFACPEDLIGFLVAVASNKVVDVVRQRMRTEKYDIDREQSLEGMAPTETDKLEDTHPSPSKVAMAKEKWEQLQDRAQRPGQRILDLLRQGITHEEIADKLGVNVKTVQRLVRNLASRARS